MPFLSRIAAFFLGLALALPVGQPASPPPSFAPPVTSANTDHVINENDPGWACWAMGNRHCARRPLEGR